MRAHAEVLGKPAHAEGFDHGRQGLNVELRPYQKQSLQLMLESEAREGGWRQQLWLPLKAVSGEPYWWSPLLLRAAWHVPAMPRGGFLAEEMVRSPPRLT